jgi:hypothetical protein
MGFHQGKQDATNMIKDTSLTYSSLAKITKAKTGNPNKTDLFNNMDRSGIKLAFRTVWSHSAVAI